MVTNLPVDDPGPIKDVMEGMSVLDARGEEVGTVAEVRMGDPQAVTDEGQRRVSGGGVLSAIAAGLSGGSKLSSQAQERLLRVGYLRVDATGMFEGDVYVAADQINEVLGDRVRLDVPAAALHAV
jgi:hypothetical protein